MTGYRAQDERMRRHTWHFRDKSGVMACIEMGESAHETHVGYSGSRIEEGSPVGYAGGKEFPGSEPALAYMRQCWRFFVRDGFRLVAVTVGDITGLDHEYPWGWGSR